MLLNFRTEVDLGSDEPAAAARTFIDLLRRGAIDTEGARVDLQLVASSARGMAIIADFQPQRVSRAAFFDDALKIVEELADLAPARLRSLQMFVTVTGFRWRGSTERSAARAVLLDGKSLRRKKRLSCHATLSLEASEIGEPAVSDELRAIEAATALRFDESRSEVWLRAADPGRATPDELLITALTWNEIVERVRRELRERVDYQREVCVMTGVRAGERAVHASEQALAVRVDFRRLAERWLKRDFPAYTPMGDPLEAGIRARLVTPQVVLGFAVDKKQGPLNRMFRVQISAGLTSRRFAAAADRPAWFAIDLFRLFGIAPVPLVFSYQSGDELSDAFASATRLLRPALELLEAQLPSLAAAHARPLSEFSGPRMLSAREAYELAAPQALRWADDAVLFRISSTVSTPERYDLMQNIHPMVHDTGRIGTSGGWWLRFHSRRLQENLHLTVPCYGSIAETLEEAPAGRQWPSEVDQTIREGWIDSTQAASIALQKARERHPGTALAGLQLESNASGVPDRLSGAPLRDGMFEMQTVWQIRLSRHEQPLLMPAYLDPRPPAA